jgi:hypothetical protein
MLQSYLILEFMLVCLQRKEARGENKCTNL